MIDPREEFKDIIRELAQEEVKSILQTEDFYRCIAGTVVTVNGNRCSVDIVTTILKDILNKSGEEIQVGDTVLVMDKYGSNFSNCFISVKNG